MTPTADTPAARLAQARLAAGFKSARKFALQIGVPYTTYQADENGKRELKPERAVKYAAELGISADELLKGNVNRSLPENFLSPDDLYTVRQIPLLDITDIRKVNALVDGRPIMPDRLVPSPAKFAAGSKAFAFEVPDQALAEARPRPIMQGDIAYIDPDSQWRTGDIVAAKIEGHPAIVLRKFRQVIVPGQKNAFELIASNDDFQTLSSTDHTIKIIGRFAGLWISA